MTERLQIKDEQQNRYYYMVYKDRNKAYPCQMSMAYTKFAVGKELQRRKLGVKLRENTFFVVYSGDLVTSYVLILFS